MDSVVSLWYYPSPVRDLEFLTRGLLLEKDHCLTAQHTAELLVQYDPVPMWRSHRTPTIAWHVNAPLAKRTAKLITQR